MKNKKSLTVLGAVAVCAALLIGYYARISTAQDQGEAASASGVVNPDSAEAGLTTQTLPQISERTFKPAPSAITGSYTEPAAPEDLKTKDAAKHAPAQKNSGK